MKINDVNRVSAVNPYWKNTDAKVANGIEKKEKPKDEVLISAEAQELLDADVSASIERGKKIQELKQSVASGTYHVEAGQVAEKLLPYI